MYNLLQTLEVSKYQSFIICSANNRENVLVSQLNVLQPLQNMSNDVAYARNYTESGCNTRPFGVIMPITKKEKIGIRKQLFK